MQAALPKRSAREYPANCDGKYSSETASDASIVDYEGGRDAELQVDHKISVADGGTDDPENLITSCANCNVGKGRKSIHKIA